MTIIMSIGKSTARRTMTIIIWEKLEAKECR